MLVHPDVHQHGGRIPLETSGVPALAMLKPFVSLLNLQTFADTLLLTHWLFRPKNHVRDVFLIRHLYVTHSEKSEIQTALFSKQSALPR